jgi:hypothetical protein
MRMKWLQRWLPVIAVSLLFTLLMMAEIASRGTYPL